MLKYKSVDKKSFTINNKFIIKTDRVKVEEKIQVEKKPNNSRIVYILIAIILIQLIRIVFVFAFEKDGKHPDESWSFGLANSYYKAHIFMTDDATEETYRNEWISGKVLKDYITVAKDQRFAYDSVVSNLKSDAHPPLFFFILHTICSMFPGSYSLWYAFVINIAAFIVIQFFLFKLSRRLLRNDYCALAVVFYYGFSIAGVSTIIYTRQYALLTVFGVLSMYLHTALIDCTEKKKYIRILILLFIVTLCGTMTHYFFLPFAFGLSLFFCIAYMLKKKWHKLVSYAFTMLMAVAFTIPFSNIASFLGATAVKDSEQKLEVLSSGMGNVFGWVKNIINRITEVVYYPDFEKRVNIVLNSAVYDLFGIRKLPFIPYIILNVIIIICFIAFIMLLLSFIFYPFTKNDNKSFFSSVINRTVNKVMSIKKERFLWLTLVFTNALLMYFVIGFASPQSMRQYTNRYFFIVYPFTAIFIFKVLAGIIKRLLSIFKTACSNKICIYVTITVIVIICGINNLSVKSIYLFPRPDYEPKIETLSKGNDVVLLISQHWLLTSYTTMLYEANRVFSSVTETADYLDYQKEISNVTTEKVIIIVDATDFQYILRQRYDLGIDGEVNRADVEDFYMDYLKETYPDRNIEFIYADKETRRDLYVYSATQYD